MLGGTLINKSYASVEHLGGLGDGRIRISLLSKERKPKLAAQERLILGENLGRQDLKFISQGFATKVSEPRPVTWKELEAWPNQQIAKSFRLHTTEALIEHSTYLHQIESVQLSGLRQPNNTLDRLAFSLLFVESYKNPQVHFQQQIRHLGAQDYDTIVHGWVYLARTAFAKLANALPLANRLEFRIRVLKAYQSEVVSNPDYVKLFDMLYDYIDTRVFSRGRMLVKAEAMIKDSLPNLKDREFNEIGFLSPGTDEGDSLHVQAERFRKLFEIGKPELLKSLNDEVRAQPETQTRFREMFSRRPLPLVLEQ